MNKLAVGIAVITASSSSASLHAMLAGRCMSATLFGALFFLAKENEQQVLSEPDLEAAVFFLLSHNGLPTNDSDYHTAQATAFVWRTPEYAVGEFTQGRLAPAHQDSDGWFCPARTLLDARLFHCPPKLAGFKKEAARIGRGNGCGRGKLCLQKDPCQRLGVLSRAAELRRMAEQIEVEAPAESGQECRTICSTAMKPRENHHVYEDSRSDALDAKFAIPLPQQVHRVGGPRAFPVVKGVGGGHGGYLGVSGSMGPCERGILTKTFWFERT